MPNSTIESRVRAELAEDVIGTYIGRLSARLALAEDQLATSPIYQPDNMIYWLKTERKNAGIDRARIFEYQQSPDALEVLIAEYRVKLEKLEHQGLAHPQQRQQEAFIRSSAAKTS